MKLKNRNSNSVNKLQALKQQQDNIISSINDLNDKNQQIIKDYMNKQQLLTDQLEKQHQQITIQELKYALHNNNWTKKVGFFLNPLSQQNGQKITIQQQQILLKHSESKLIQLERIFQTESKIIQFQEQKKMIQNDVEGRILQMDTLLIEYEELEQIIDSQQNKSQCNNVKTLFEINKSLSQLKHNYILLANQRQEKEIIQTDIIKVINNLELQTKSIQIEKQMKGLQSSWFNVDQLYNSIVSQAKAEQQLDLFCNIVLLINDKIVKGLNSKVNQNVIIDSIRQIENDNKFRVFNSTVFQEYLDQAQIVEYSQFLTNELTKRISKFKIESKLKQHKAHLVDIQRQIHQIMYEQSMIQTQYNRLESNLPVLEKNQTALRLQQILDRMNHIECLKSQNKTLFEITFPAQIKEIQNNVNQMEQQLQSQIKELHYSIQIEQDYYYKIFSSQSQKLPILILDSNIVNDNIEQQIEENRRQYQQQQILYNQNIENYRQKLKQLEDQENQMQTKYLMELNESILKTKKENIPPSDSRDVSMIGTIQIDMSQERTTHKYSVLRSKKQLFMNEPTDRSLSAYSFLGHRSSDPLCSKTKLALKQQTSLSSQTSQKNPLLSPQSNNHHISIEQSLSLHSSARRFPDFQMEKSPPQQMKGDRISIFKVLKRTFRQQSSSNQSGCSAFSSKFVKCNQKMKCLEFYNSNRMIHDLGQKESALCLRQIKEVKQCQQSLILVISKHQSIELVFSKHEQLNEFMKMITQ
ncbi:unnamed protein product (macronuclear) [Paramecium tetraurelia]|uniref:Uncharacterized protein n=1 Tax=Paramecium tetraurelia TaxID=5888 RepID=A0D7H7_PARTE|nr:uncharacterized protein GSPATT00002036001 [Paramecium tetraurelia]CAK78994.1 unnamed protein product [Paramecium tetraurelia]|eukprot:XP_001446391.1 hypothetical protein (macronuclear) [Paramecium tetraurelia strain d4-2]